jgi:release factor glutamine methyltransferase
LLRRALDLEQSELYLRLADRLSSREQERFERLLERRAAREPLAYITGCKEFWSLDFEVTPAVLIPRPETELLVELALGHVRENHAGQTVKILDIGTGSGAIAVSLAVHLPDAEIWAADISSAALRVAESNARRHGVEKRTRFFHSDLFEGLAGTGAIFDLIVSNPPYIRRRELPALAPEIRDWEPVAALDGGSDGLEYYPKIIDAAWSHLIEGGTVLLEIGSDLAEPVAGFFAGTGAYLPARVHLDYAGRERVVTAVKGASRG